MYVIKPHIKLTQFFYIPSRKLVKLRILLQSSFHNTIIRSLQWSNHIHRLIISCIHIIFFNYIGNADQLSRLRKSSILDKIHNNPRILSEQLNVKPDYIHNCSLQSSSQYDDIAYPVCINFIHEWRVATVSSQFRTTEFFEKVFTAICCF